MTWESGFVDIPDGRIAFHRTGGNAPPLLLAHGGTDNGLGWSRVASALQQDFDVVMVDLRSHGRSTRVAPEIEDPSADDLALVITALGLGRPAVMGHSLGARTVARLAADNPSLVSRVVLEDPPFAEFRPPADFIQQFKDMQTLSEAEIIAIGKRMSPKWHDDEFPSWAMALKQVDFEFISRLNFANWEEPIRRIKAPTLVIYADVELRGIVTHASAKKAVGINPRVTLAHIPGAGHNIRREKFDQYVTVVSDFLNQ
jgi:N-formylmaleamate deformylase